jgi:RNA polymerase sigma factor (sigma-70 family)
MSGQNGARDPRIEQYEKLIRSFLRRHDCGSNAAEVDDLLQEAKIRLWKVLENGQDIEYLAAYIRKIVDSIVMNHLQKVVQERAFLSSADWRVFSENQAARKREDDHRRELKEEVRDALGSLVSSRRTVLQMTIAGLSIAEITAAQKWTLKKTYNLYERGLKDLKRIFGDKGRLP